MRRKLLLAFLSTSLVLVAAGCGGGQNPWKVQNGYGGPAMNGLWDGFIAIPLFVRNLFHRHHYLLYTHHATDAYYIFFAIGVLILLAAVSKVVDIIF